MNTFALSYMKFRAFPYHLSVQLVQDLGCAVGCYPTFAVWAYHDYLNLFYGKKESIIENISKEDMSAEELIE